MLIEFTSYFTYALHISNLGMWLTGQSSWLQIHRSGFDSRHYQIFREVLGLERGPLNLMSITEKLLGKKSSVPGLENRDYGLGMSR
jgi:hypothetical protein